MELYPDFWWKFNKPTIRRTWGFKGILRFQKCSWRKDQVTSNQSMSSISLHDMITGLEISTFLQKPFSKVWNFFLTSNNDIIHMLTWTGCWCLHVYLFWFIVIGLRSISPGNNNATNFRRKTVNEPIGGSWMDRSHCRRRRSCRVSSLHRLCSRMLSVWDCSLSGLRRFCDRMWAVLYLWRDVQRLGYVAGRFCWFSFRRFILDKKKKSHVFFDNKI